MFNLTSHILVIELVSNTCQELGGGIHQIATTCMGMSPTNTHMSSSYNNYFSHQRMLRQENYWIITACHLLHSEWFRHDTQSLIFPPNVEHLNCNLNLYYRVMRGEMHYRGGMSVEMIKPWWPDHLLPQPSPHPWASHWAWQMRAMPGSAAHNLHLHPDSDCPHPWLHQSSGNPMCLSRTLCRQTNYICHIIVTCDSVSRWSAGDTEIYHDISFPPLQMLRSGTFKSWSHEWTRDCGQ